MLKLNSRFLASSISVAALTIGMAVAQPAQKASAQTAGGSTAAADLYRGFGLGDYQAIGSGAGVAAFNAGTLDIGATDIPVTAPDGATLRPVANLRIEAPVNGGVVGGLDQSTVCAIFRGEVTNYNQVGGPDQPVVVVYRSDNSGTKFIINNNCGGDGSGGANAIGVGSTSDVINTVANTPGAIGYAEQANLNGLSSAVSSPFSGTTYALVGNDNDAANAFIDNILANPDQVTSLGYNPL